MLANPQDTRAIYLLVDDPKKYHKFAVAENTVGMTRKMALKRLFQPLRNFQRIIG
jgi:formate dehydrogenase iron-sulfur subunit